MRNKYNCQYENIIFLDRMSFQNKTTWRKKWQVKNNNAVLNIEDLHHINETLNNRLEEPYL